MRNVILASTSIYRKQLLEQLGLIVTSASPVCDEGQFKTGEFPPNELAIKLSALKAQSIAIEYPDKLIISGDQVAALGDQLLSKPGNYDQAFIQLTKLAGKTHKLYTAITVKRNQQEETLLNITTLKMKPLNAKQIEYYLNFDSPFDCAGSYKIESLGISLFSSIDTTDHTAIVGVPLMELSILLEKFNIDLFN